MVYPLCSLASATKSAFHCGQKFILSDGSSIKNRSLVDQYAITAALGPFTCFPLRVRGFAAFSGIHPAPCERRVFKQEV